MFLTELMVTHPFPSLGRRAPWVLLLHAEQRALWQPAAAAPVQGAVLLWQRPLLVICPRRRSGDVPHQIHRYEPSWAPVSMAQRWISSDFVLVGFLAVTFSLMSYREWLGLKGTLADCLVQLPCSSKAFYMEECSGPPGEQADRKNYLLLVSVLSSSYSDLTCFRFVFKILLKLLPLDPFTTSLIPLHFHSDWEIGISFLMTSFLRCHISWNLTKKMISLCYQNSLLPPCVLRSSDNVSLELREDGDGEDC